MGLVSTMEEDMFQPTQQQVDVVDVEDSCSQLPVFVLSVLRQF